MLEVPAISFERRFGNKLVDELMPRNWARPNIGYYCSYEGESKASTTACMMKVLLHLLSERDLLTRHVGFLRFIGDDAEVTHGRIGAHNLGQKFDHRAGTQRQIAP